MTRTVLISGAASFLMAFMGTIAAITLALPTAVGAQEARIRAEQFTGVGDNGADRIRLTTQPGINASVTVLDSNGVQRANMGTGRGPAGDDPDSAGFNVFTRDGFQVVRLGMAHGPTGDQPLSNILQLYDWQGQGRILLRIDENGTPAMRIFDASGNVIWSAP